MHLSTSNVQYILAKFDAGVPPHRILIGLQDRAFLPNTDVATIEQCLYDNGRLMKPHQAAITVKDDQSPGVDGHASDSLPPANNEGAPSASTTTTQEVRQLPTDPPTTDNLATDDAAAPGPMLPWDAQADDFTLAAFRVGKSRDEIWKTLQGRGYDITRYEFVKNLIRVVCAQRN